MTDKEWIELCNERHTKTVDFDYRNCTRDEAIAALDLLEEAHSIAFSSSYENDNETTHFFEELIKVKNGYIDVLDSIIKPLRIPYRKAMKKIRKNMKMFFREMPYKKTRLPRKLKKKYKKLGIYEQWKEENL